MRNGRRIKPHWPYLRYSGTGILCRRALNMFCGVDDLSDETVPIIGDRVRALWQPGTYRKLFKEQHGIRVIVNTRNVEPVEATYADAFFAPLIYTSNISMTQTVANPPVGRASGCRSTREAFLNAVDPYRARYKQPGWWDQRAQTCLVRDMTMSPRMPRKRRRACVVCAFGSRGARLDTRSDSLDAPLPGTISSITLCTAIEWTGGARSTPGSLELSGGAITTPSRAIS